MEKKRLFLLLVMSLLFSSLVFAGPNENVCFSDQIDPATGKITGYNSSQVSIESEQIRTFSSRDTIPPSFTISHIENGDVTIHVISDEELFTGWVDEKLIWSVSNFNFWWLNTRLAKDADNNIYTAIKKHEYSNPSGNYDRYDLSNNGEIEEEFLDWNGPSGNPLIVNYPDENIYLGKPVIDKEGAVDSNNMTYIFWHNSSTSGNIIYFTKIDADGTVLISDQPIITGVNPWNYEVRVAIDTNDRLYIVWSDGMHDITYAYSDDGGDTWSETISLCYNANYQMNSPQICCDNNNNVHIIWQRWTGSSYLLAYMKLRPDGTIAIGESHLTQNDNFAWSPHMDIDEENNLHIVWATMYSGPSSAYYTKINGNLDGNGLSMTDAELSLVQEFAYLNNQNIRYPKCVVDDYQNVHSIYEQGDYGCNHPKSVYYKKMNSAPLLRIECPDDSILFVEMTGSGTTWEGVFTPPELGIYNVRVSASDVDGNTGVDYYQFEYTGSGIDDSELSIVNFQLSNYPNPFNPSTTIQFEIKESETAELAIYNIKGQIVESKTFETGSYNYEWNSKDNASGVYFYKLSSESYSEVKKMILLK